MSEKNGNGGLPSWAKVIGLVGLPGFITLGLLGFFPWFESPLHKIANAVSSHDAATSSKLDTLIVITRQNCLNTAKTDAQERGCWRDR